MGCFLACFGYTKKPKRRKSGKKVLSRDQGHGSYEPLQPEVTVTFNITEKPIASDSEPRDKAKDRSSSKIKKKVSFNLNVRTYEPIPNDEATDYFSESDEKAMWEKEEEETAKASTSISHSEEDSTGSRMGSYHSNYRYQSCRASYDEEDNIKLEESDLDDEYIVDTDEEDSRDSNDDDDGQRTSQVEFLEQFSDLFMESNRRVTFAQSDEEKTNNLIHFHALSYQEPKKFELNHNVRDRSQYVHSVLNPVENLTQWKAVKAREAPPLKHHKENIGIKQEQIRLNSMPSFNPLPCNSKSNLNHSKALMQGIAVDASLSNWVQPNERHQMGSHGSCRNNTQ